MLRRLPAEVGRWLIYVLILVVFVLPYVWMITSSLRPHAEIHRYTSPLQWRTFVPVQFTLTNYQEILVGLGFARAIANSLFVAVVTVGASLIINSMAAYALARMRFRGRDVVFGLALVILTVPQEATIIPLYIVVRELHMQDSYAALILPWIARPFNIFLLRQFFLELPRELEEAAVVDGCGRLRIYWSVMMPNIKPALVTSAMIDFLLSWDAFFWPLVVIQSPDLQLVQVAIASMIEPDITYWERIFAACTLVSVPVVIVFLKLQRYYVRGMVLSGLKG